MTTKMTAKEQSDQTDQLVTHVLNAQKMVDRVRVELENARATLEDLREYQHPKISMEIPHRLKSKSIHKQLSPGRVIEFQIESINAVLGDRP